MLLPSFKTLALHRSFPGCDGPKKLTFISNVTGLNCPSNSAINRWAIGASNIPVTKPPVSYTHLTLPTTPYV